MVHVLLDVNKIDYNSFFQYGEGGIQFFEGLPFQRGYGRRRQRGQGLGTVISSLWRFVSPVLRQLGTDMGRETLSTGSRLLGDMSQGAPIKEALREQTKRGARNLLSTTADHYLQKGKGKRRPQRKLIGRAFTVAASNDVSKKRTKKDALGDY